MSNITIERKFRTNIYEVATPDPVLGGPVSLDVNGDPNLGTAIANVHGKQLGDRTEWLKWRHAMAGPSKRNAVHSCAKNLVTGKPSYVTFPTATTAQIFITFGPLVLGFAGGFDEHGPLDYYKFVDVNTAVTVTTGTGVEKLFAIYDDVTDTVSFVSITDNYYFGVDVPNPVSYKYWFDPEACIFYESDGVATWSQIFGIYLGNIDFSGPSTDLHFPGEDIIGDAMPTGTVLPFAAANAPKGYMICDGSAISRYYYAHLFSVIGTSFGVGDGSTTFNIPDMQGKFIRGFDAGGAIDPGRTFGDYQLDQIKSHNHFGSPDAELPSFLFDNPSSGTFQVKVDHTPGTGIIQVSESANTGDNSIPGSPISETTVKNIAMSYVIKY